MVLLVPFPEPLQDLDRFFPGGWIYDHRLEAPLQRAVLLDVLPVFVERGRTHALEFSARERRLQHVRCVNGSFGRARSDEGVQLVDEQHDVLVLRDLVHYRLESLLELAAVLRSRDDRCHIERQDPVVTQRVGRVAGRDELRKALDDRGLAHPGLTDEHRIVLLAS